MKRTRRHSNTHGLTGAKTGSRARALARVARSMGASTKPKRPFEAEPTLVKRLPTHAPGRKEG